jgi:argininosuccinate lyase
MTGETGASPAKRTWHLVGRILAAHAVMLRDAGMIDDDAMVGLLQAIESTRLGSPTSDRTMIATIREFDERVDAILPSGLQGTVRVGRGTLDVAAGALRAELREEVLELSERVHALRETLIELATAHVLTLLPVTIDGQVAQPSTLGHVLAGTVSQLGRAASRLEAAYATINQSPLGSGALASTGMPIDRERLTDLIGFDGLIENTLDAVSATDEMTALADALDAVTVPVRRLLEELLLWIRAEPTSFRFGDEWASLLSDLPQARPAVGLSALIADLRAVSSTTTALKTAASETPFGPIAGELDRLHQLSRDALAAGGEALNRATSLFVSGFEVNRALLANRAGKGFSTSSDLADFLMIEEQIEPGAAQNIAALTISRAREQGLEAAGITVDLIDGAALLVIGREIKVEFEAISRYLAPRRFIERRTAPGSPAPAVVRAHLDSERARLAQDSQRLASARERLARADAELTAIEATATTSVSG